MTDDEMHDKLRTARAIAQAVIDRIAQYGGRYALFVMSNGESRVCPSDGKRHAQYSNKYPSDFVGVYERGAKRDRIASDILLTLVPPPNLLDD
jgi:hypothetical protein